MTRHLSSSHISAEKSSKRPECCRWLCLESFLFRKGRSRAWLATYTTTTIIIIIIIIIIKTRTEWDFKEKYLDTISQSKTFAN